MLFNSIEFLIFLSIVFLLYWFAARVRWAQNILLLVSSYVFYGWWDSRFLLLIVLSSVVDYCVGIGIADASSQRRRRLMLSVSLALNLGLLGVFKYYNFFVESFVELLSLLGVEASPARLNVILPVGISFYTFQTLSYSIDIYRKRLKPTRDFVAFCAFVSFFPQLVAGPIERAGHLLPQFLADRHFDYAKAVDGLRQALWGFFKKVVIADNCAIYADQAFNGFVDYNSLSLVLGAFCFSLQIYCDFSGYSDIAIGVSRLFGFSLVRNFAFPYFSRDVAEFWRRWHISLSTWFRDYVYIPLGGSQFSRAHTIRNTFFVFILSGLWHGANWTFVVWGLLNALYVLPLQIAGLNRRFLKPEHGSTKILPTFAEAIQIGMTFSLTVLAWVFFRAESLDHAVAYLGRIVACDVASNAIHMPTDLCAIIGGFLAIEWLQKDHQHPLDFSGRQVSRPRRWAIYYGVIVLILIFGGEQQDFIYFQF